MSPRRCGGGGAPACLSILVSHCCSPPLTEGPLPPRSQRGSVSGRRRRPRPRGVTPFPFQGTTSSPAQEAWPLRSWRVSGTPHAV